jgi:hypothetical protein
MVWFGEWQLVCLTQEKDMTDPLVRQLVVSNSLRWLWSDGSNSPVHGTNLKIRLYILGLMVAKSPRN